MELEVVEMTYTQVRAPRGMAQGALAPPPPEGRATRLVTAGLMLFTAAGGVFGGVEMLRHPLEPMGATTDLIQGSPFHTFTWPGVLLLVLVGIVPAVIAVGVVVRVRWALALGAAWGAGMMAWIVTQWVLLPQTLWLQPLFFGVGAAVTAVAALGLRRGLR
jgi:hypothetical protein